MGFGIRMGQEIELLPGGGLRVVGPRGSLSLERNGLLTWVVTAGSDFLAWADQKRGRTLSINPLTLVESTFEFTRFAAEQVSPSLFPSAGSFMLAGGMQDLHEDGRPTVLKPGRSDELDHSVDWSEPSEESFGFGPFTLAPFDPKTAALLALREIYAEFGLPPSGIPYVLGDQIDPRLITNS
jgi:hypothetical protein